MQRRFMKLVIPLTAITLAASCADDLVTNPQPLTKYGAPSGGGGGGGGGGGDDAVGNNLSYPVLWADASYVKVLRGTPGMEPVTGGTWWWWWGVIPGGEGTADVPLSCPPSPADEMICLDNTSPGAGAVKAYVQKDAFNTWQAGTAVAAGNVEVDWIDWGDDLEAKAWTLSSQVRIEHVVSDAVATPMTEYVMRHTSGWGIDEVHGLSVIPSPRAVEMLDNYLPTVFSACARLTIQRLAVARDDARLADGLTWNALTHEWTEADGVTDDLVRPAIFNKAVYEAADGPGYYNAEINVKGKIIYGYTWGVRKLNDGAGDYRITFGFDSASCPALANTFITEATQIVQPEEEGEVVVAEEPVSSGGVGMLRPDLNLTYMDIRITSQKGGGGGRGLTK